MDLKLIPEKYDKDKKSDKSSGLPAIGFSHIGAYLASKINFLLVLFLILLIGAALGYFWMLGYKNDLEDKKEALASNIKTLQNQRNMELETNFIRLKDKIDVLKVVLKKRLYPSRIFKMLEELALSKIRFVNLEADLSQASIILGIEAAGYNTLARQLIVFKDDPRIKKVNVSELSLDKSGKISSQFLLEIDTDFLWSK